ncbi:MAG: hypothetical protein HFACDABA_00749 [Anaerolineales bacterium]|nr:hypothetical protein [Anaerolineales bacterium]
MRFKRIDVFRIVAIFLVLWAHTQFFDGITPQGTFARVVERVAVIAMRCAIPFFFIASGYFVGGRIMEEGGAQFHLTWKYSKKLLIVFAAWCAIYAAESPSVFLDLLRENPETLFFVGTRIHLWFLPALLLAILCFRFWPFDKRGNSFLAFGLVLFVVGLLGGSYAITPIGLDLRFNTRNAIFFSVPFFAIGAQLHTRKPIVTARMAWGLFFLGLALFLFETYVLWARWSALPIRHDYLLGSIPYGLGFFLIAYAARDETRLENTLASYSKYVLGIYVSHMLFIDAWSPVGVYFPQSLWAFLLPVLVFFSSLLAVAATFRTPLRWLVS